jgi:hypothetical protein
MPAKECQETKEALVAYAGRTGTLKETFTLGVNYSIWGTALDRYQKLLKAEAKGMQESVGSVEASGNADGLQRGLYPEIAKVKLSSCRTSRFRGWQAQGGGSIELKGWRVVIGWVRTLSRWSKKGLGGEHKAVKSLCRVFRAFLAGDDELSSMMFQRLDENEGRRLLGECHILMRECESGRGYDVDDLVLMLEGFSNEAHKRGRAKAKEAFAEWVHRALKNGAGPAHRWTNQANALPPLRLVIKVPDGSSGHRFEADPDAVAELHARPWREEWEVGNDELGEEEDKVVRQARDDYILEAEAYAESKDWGPRAIRRACGTFPTRTAIGSDDVTFLEVAELPDGALGILGALMKAAVVHLALPMQTLLNVMVLLGKKGGGSRTVAILATFYRLLMRMLGDEVTQWDERTAGHWDSAVRGSSALRAQVARALEVEVADVEGLFCLHFLWDFS